MNPVSPDGQDAFSAALMSPDMPVPQNVVDPDGRIAPKRFAVYRNNVTVSLIEALRQTFASVNALVGEAFFSEMARPFVRATPPKSPVMGEYGREFPAHVANFKPAAGLPFLADVARLDRAFLDAYHAADAMPLSASDFAGVGGAELAGARFLAHPAMRLVPSSFPLVAIWETGRRGTLEGAALGDDGQWALVTRPDVEVKVTPLSAAEGQFFMRLSDSKPLGPAAEAALGHDSSFDMARVLGLILATGAFTRLELS